MPYISALKDGVLRHRADNGILKHNKVFLTISKNLFRYVLNILIICYSNLLSSGNTVFESQSKEAKAEINQITNEILTALGVQ